jgi:phosphoglycolate phosphatase
MLLNLMSFLAAEPPRTLMIGDTTHDLQLAKNAGAQALAVAYGAHPAAELAGHAPLAIVDSIAALRTWLDCNG